MRNQSAILAVRPRHVTKREGSFWFMGCLVATRRGEADEAKSKERFSPTRATMKASHRARLLSKSAST